MCTADMQKNLPDFMTNLQGTSVTTPGDKDYTGPRPIKKGVDVPLDTGDGDERGIRQRRDKIMKAQDVPLGTGLAGSARKDIISREEKLRIAMRDSGA